MVNGKKMRRIREDMRMTAWELAEKVGCSEVFICAIERGTREPKVSLLKAIADELSLKVDDLVD